MRFRPTRVVHVTTKEALDSALVSADQVVVEGDDQLLSYAAAKASHDPELARVDIEIAGRSISLGRDAAGDIVMSGDRNPGPPGGGTGNDERSSPLPPPPPFERMASAAPRKSGLGVLLGLAIALALMAAAAFGYFALTAAPKAPEVQSSPSPSPAIAGTQGNISIPPPSPDPAASSNGIPQILASLAWPAVAIAAIVALFFIARQAIAGGRNVEISWKVTEKVTGRVVITKVRSRASNTRSAA